MRSATVFASALAFAASAFAADPTEGYAVVLSPAEGQNVPAGKDFTIKWDAGKYSGPAGISLLAGVDPAHLEVVDTIAAGGVEVKDNSYSWHVDCTLGEAKTYGLQIFSVADDGATFQYSFPFHIKGPSCGNDDNGTTTTSISASASVSASATVTNSGYPVESPTKSSNSTVKPTHTSTSVSSVKSYPVESTSSTLVTVVTTTALTTVTSYPATTTAPATTAPATTPTPTPTSSPVPTGGAARVGAGVAFGLAAVAFAL